MRHSAAYARARGRHWTSLFFVTSVSPCLRGSLAFVPSLIILLCGCNPSANYSSWQRSVEDYVWSEANGDLGALRNLTWDRDTRHGFVQLAGSRPDESTDAKGILLGHREIAGRPRFIFIVGLVKNRRVKDIRLAVLAANAGQFSWQMSDAGGDAWKTYRDYRLGLWSAAHPDEDPPAEQTEFPALDDVFNLAIDGPRITITHKQSGAIWSIDVETSTRSEP